MNSWSLSKKIWAILGLLIFAFVGCVYIALNGMKNIDKNLTEVTTVYVKRDQLTSDIQDDQRVLTITSFEQILETEPKKIAEAKQRFDEDLVKMRKNLGEYDHLATSEGKAFLGKYVIALDNWLLAEKKSEAFAAKNLNDEAYKTLSDASQYRTDMKDILSSMNTLTAKDLASKSTSSRELSSDTINMTLAISVTAIFTSLLIAFFALRNVTRIINEIVSSLFDSSTQVSSAAGQVASSSQQLSNATTEQAASLEETAASIEELNSMVAKNSENADSTSVTSDESKIKATEGKTVVAKMISSMDDINISNNKIMEQVNIGNNKIAKIVKVIEEISVKTNVINEIVFQTKLLSFNASVEAARAGENGKGFAVVAQEIGSLAEMSGKAAKEIGVLLASSTHRVNDIVVDTRTQVERLITEGRKTVESGNTIARQCGQVLDEIVQNVSSVSSMAKEIAHASIEQSLGVSEITKAMGQLDQVTQQNSATSEECATAAEELSAQAEVLRKAVGQLKVAIQGGRASLGDAQREKVGMSTYADMAV